MLRRIGASATMFNSWKKGISTPEKHIPKLALILNTSEAYLRCETDISLPDTVAMLDGSNEPLKPQNPKVVKILSKIEGMSADELKLVDIFIDTIRRGRD